MKKRYFLAVCLFFSIFVSCSKEKEGDSKIDGNIAEEYVTVKVMSENGMILREKPDRKSSRIDAIPWGAEIEMIDSNGPMEIIGDTGGCWVKVKYLDRTGWVFGGYLTRKVGNDFVKITNNIDIFAEFGFNLDISWDDGKDEIIRKIGEPVKTETDKYVSSEDSREYPRYLLKYRSFTIEIIEFQKDSYINSIELFSHEHQMLFDLKTGDMINRLIEIVGKPSEIEKTKMKGKEFQIYQFIPIDNKLFQGIDVYVLKGRISKILWYRAAD